MIAGTVSGTVPATLSLSLGTPATLRRRSRRASARDYLASTTANVISTAGDATLSVADPSSNATGRLVNGSFSLAQALQARANNGAYAAVGGSSTPTSILTYNGPISNDLVTIGFRQTIGAERAVADRRVRQDADVHVVDDESVALTVVPISTPALSVGVEIGSMFGPSKTGEGEQ